MGYTHCVIWTSVKNFQGLGVKSRFTEVNGIFAMDGHGAKCSP